MFELAALQAQRGQHAAALATWQQWLARFPEGVLHPEARLALFVELSRERRFDEARAAAAEFERTCAGDPRLPEVARLRDALPSAR
ncbi:MAG: hypothetical protein ACOZQL_40910 [Myxococcota bacterium]